MTTEATVVFVIVVGLRFLLPLFIPRWPLPAMLACLVLDGIDQSIFQAFGFDPPGYQNYDKAMDLFYLSIAFLSSLQNWTALRRVGISRFLFFYRMVGVMAFEITGVRTLLLIFPNTFEYFFIAYEAVRLRWDPRAVRHAGSGWSPPPASGSSSSCRRSTGSTWPSSTSPTPGRTCRGSRRSSSGRSLVGLAILWFVVRPRLLPADWSWRVAADPLPEEMDTAAERDAWTAANVRVWSWSTLEKVVLIGLLSTIYARILPGPRGRPTCGCSSASRPTSSSTPPSRSPSRSGPAPARAWPATSGCGSSSTSGWCCWPGSSSAPTPSTCRPRSSSCCCSRCSSRCTTASPRWPRCAPSTTTPTPSRPRRSRPRA